MQRSNAVHVLYGLYANVRGPIKTFYDETLHGSPFLVACALIAAFMCLLQVIFLAVKLSPSSTSTPVIRAINWGVVLLPTWILFTVCLLLVSIMEPAVLFLAFLLFWLPLFILIVSLTVKLNGVQYHNKNARIRMALIFLPFWIIEGSIMAGSFFYLLFGLYSRQVGVIDRLREHTSPGMKKLCGERLTSVCCTVCVRMSCVG